MQQKRRFYFLQPIFFAVVLILGMYFGFKFSDEIREATRSKSGNKFDQILRLIDKKYVDSVNLKDIQDQTIEDLLSKLDPHSIYIPAENVSEVNETLEGNFDGIGIEFFLLKDTIYVVSAISGGPSEQLGIRSGDKIIKINGKLMAGKKIKNSDVTSNLRGESGSIVKVSILRKGVQKLIDFTIKRGKIPLNSVDVSYMAAPTIGYIKINTFAASTYDEFYESIAKLKSEGLQSLILDLRGNPGGYLTTAIMIADEFLGDKKLIVYTMGNSSPKKQEFATSAGNFEKGKLIVMVDEGSASASEIVSGAVQDWDRGIIVGRRSFGKGLVQEQASLLDGSSLRLTIARYYTPTGRCIQKPYKNGEDYGSDMVNRYLHGELTNADSILNNKSEQFKTPGGKTVYGGGGITPDVFIPLDTSDYSVFYGRLVSEGILSEFCYNYSDLNKAKFQSLKTINDFINGFEVTNEVFDQLLQFAKKKGLNYQNKDLSKSGTSIKIQLKAIIARQYFKNEGYYRIMSALDMGLQKSVELLKAS